MLINFNHYTIECKGWLHDKLKYFGSEIIYLVQEEMDTNTIRN